MWRTRPGKRLQQVAASGRNKRSSVPGVLLCMDTTCFLEQRAFIPWVKMDVVFREASENVGDAKITGELRDILGSTGITDKGFLLIAHQAFARHQ